MRPVVEVGTVDVHTIDQVLAAAAGAAPTIAAAVHAAYAQLVSGHTHLGAEGSHRLAIQRLTAASEGTPHGAALAALTIPGDPETSALVHRESQRILTAMIIRWICHADHYTDPAVTIAGLG